MSVNVFFSVKPKEVNLRMLTLGLAKLGLNNKAIDQLYTFRKGDDKYINVLMDSLPGHDEVQSIQDQLNKYGICELIGADMEAPMMVFTDAKDKKPDTKLRIWYDRATYN